MNDHCIYIHNSSSCESTVEKKSGFSGIRAHLWNRCRPPPCQLGQYRNTGAAQSSKITRYSKQIMTAIVNSLFLASYHNEAIVRESFQNYLFQYGSCKLLVCYVSQREKKSNREWLMLIVENVEFAFNAFLKVDKIKRNSSNTKNMWKFW